MDNETIIALTADIVSAHVSNSQVPSDGLAGLIQSVYSALASVGTPAETTAPVEPAVSIRSSVKPASITCLECGKRFKMLKRHLNTDHGLLPADYRTKWGLAASYPLVAPEYAAKRAELAMKIGLGRKPGTGRKAAAVEKPRTGRAKKAPVVAAQPAKT